MRIFGSMLRTGRNQDRIGFKQLMELANAVSQPVKTFPTPFSLDTTHYRV